MVDKETRDEIIRLCGIGMAVIVDKTHFDNCIIEYGEKYYSLWGDVEIDNVDVHEVHPVKETITRWWPVSK